MKKAVFLDRDGTIIYDVHFLSRLEDCVLLPGVASMLRSFQTAGYELIVVTNQGGIARGFFDAAFVQQTHVYLSKMLAAEGVFIKAFYFCPHHPTEAKVKDLLIDCSCRKPKPGMLLQAAADHAIDLRASFMIGNAPSDLAAGAAAGCQSFHIDTALASFQDGEKLNLLIPGLNVKAARSDNE